MKFNKELVKGSTSILLLSLLAREDMYGYMLVQRLKSESENAFEMKEGTLYPMLHALENEGAVEAYWDEGENGKKRRYYRITANGRTLLEEKKREWRDYSKAVDKVVGFARLGGELCAQ